MGPSTPLRPNRITRPVPPARKLGRKNVGNVVHGNDCGVREETAAAATMIGERGLLAPGQREQRRRRIQLSSKEQRPQFESLGEQADENRARLRQRLPTPARPALRVTPISATTFGIHFKMKGTS